MRCAWTQVIGATTLGEFRKYLERDAALERRFQPVHVGEASPDQALAILGSLQVIFPGVAARVYISNIISRHPGQPAGDPPWKRCWKQCI